MRLGFYTYSYTDRLRLPIEACFARIAKAGYTGVDVSGTDGPSTSPHSVTPALRRATRQTAERLGLRVEAVITHACLSDSLADPRQTPLDLEGSVDLALDVGAPLVTFHMGGYPPGVAHDAFRRSIAARISM